MNSFLANALGVANTVLAALLILGSMAVFGNAVGMGGLGIVVGLVVGLVLAVVVCGLLAILVEIRRELVRIREALAKA